MHCPRIAECDSLAQRGDYRVGARPAAGFATAVAPYGACATRSGDDVVTAAPALLPAGSSMRRGPDGCFGATSLRATRETMTAVAMPTSSAPPTLPPMIAARLKFNSDGGATGSLFPLVGLAVDDTAAVALGVAVPAAELEPVCDGEAPLESDADGVLVCDGVPGGCVTDADGVVGGRAPGDRDADGEVDGKDVPVPVPVAVDGAVCEAVAVADGEAPLDKDAEAVADTEGELDAVCEGDAPAESDADGDRDVDGVPDGDAVAEGTTGAPTTRMRLLSLSAMSMSPPPLTATPDGQLRRALVAGPRSPLLPWGPLPATVVMTPETTERTRLLPESAMSSVMPSPPRFTAVGYDSDALMADPPSPLKAGVPLPATVVITCASLLTERTRWLYSSAMNSTPSLRTATPLGHASIARVASPPSPPKPSAPVPATVVMTPFASTCGRGQRATDATTLRGQ